MSKNLRHWSLLVVCLLATPCLAGDDSRPATAEELQAANRVLLDTQASATARNEAVRANFPWGKPVAPRKFAHQTTLLCQPALVQLYDCDLQVPLWVGYQLPENNAHQGPRPDRSRVEGFRPDPRLAGADPVDPNEYTVPFVTSPGGRRRAVYDKGHLAPNADFPLDLWAMVNSFVMSNMCPQLGAFNSGIWQNLENLVRGWADRYDCLYVTTGALFITEPGRPLQYTWMGTPRPGRRTDPLLQGPGAWPAATSCRPSPFILPHAKKPDGLTTRDALKGYLASVDEVESAAHFNLLAGLPNPAEQALEAAKPTALWE